MRRHQFALFTAGLLVALAASPAATTAALRTQGGATVAPEIQTRRFPAAEATRIRAELGLNASPEYVERSLSDPTGFPVMDYYGMPVSRAEAAELSRRVLVQQSAAASREWAAQQHAWAGAYTDQRAGGVPVFLFADDPDRYRTQIENLLPPETSFRVERVDRTMQDLLSLKAELVEDWGRLEAEGVDLQSVGIDVMANRVTAGVTSPLDLAVLSIGQYPAGVDVTMEAPAELDACTSRAACSPPLKGGLRITAANGSFCTSAYIAEQDNYSPAHLRVVTAGHCIELNGGIGGAWSHNGAVFGHATAETWANGADGDVGVIDRTNIHDPDNQFYASSNTDIRAFTSYALLSEIGVNDFMCRSGATTGYVCGRVVQLDQSLDVDGRTIDHQIRVDFDASPGDSGGPYWFGNTLYGIHSDSTNDGEPAPRFAWFTPYVWASIVVSDVDVCLTATC